MTTLFIDPSGGASGDKLLAALIDAGFNPAELLAALAPLTASQGLTVAVSPGSRGGLRGMLLSVEAPGQPEGRSAEELSRIIEGLPVPSRVRDRSLDAIGRLATAEAAVHGGDPRAIHFHEVGGLDTVVDVVGFFLALESLRVTDLICSPVPLGSGTIRTAHGILPVPAPATAELLRGIPVWSPPGENGELTTPTGALLLVSACRFGPFPPMTCTAIGTGLGHREIPGLPNILRVFLGEGASTGERDVVSVIETVVDDMEAELLGSLEPRLRAAGALDAWLSPATLRGGRPGTQVTVIAPPALRDDLIDLLFAETTTFGIRHRLCDRETLDRRTETVETGFGKVTVKVGMRRGVVVTVSPEHRECERVAGASGLPLREVYRLVSSLAEGIRRDDPAGRGPRSGAGDGTAPEP